MVQHPRAAVTVAATTTNQVINSIINLLQLGRIQKAASILFAFPLPFPHSLYAHFFRHCTSPKAIVAAHKVEFHLVATTPNPPTFLRNRALEAYAKCSSLHDARELFDQMPHRDGGSWNALITAYSRLRYPDEALSLFLSMNRSGVRANKITFAGVLSSCAAVSELPLSQQVHGLVVKFGFCGNVIIGSALVDVYAKCGVMVYARRMFYEMPLRNAVTWNVIVRRYLDVGDVKEAVFMFTRMFYAGVKPLNFTFSNALVACSSMQALEEGMQIHGVVVKWGLREDNVVSSSLINMYVKCGELENGSRVFHQLVSKDLVSWTCIVSGYAMSGKTWDARRLFDQMPERNVISWNAMLAGYTRFFKWYEAFDFVGFVKEVDDFSLSALVSGYANAGRMRDARRIFDNISDPCSVLWNSIISGYVSNGEEMEALYLFNSMRRNGIWGDFSVVANILSAARSLLNVELVKQMHDHAFKIGATRDIVVSSALLDAYSKCQHPHEACKLFGELKAYDAILLNTMITVYCNCGRIEDAKWIFNTMPNKTLISWNSILVGFTQNACPNEALDTFCKMNNLDVKMDKFSFASVISACASKSSLELGQQVFAKAITLGLESDQIISTSLVDFYCKCGLVEMGRKVFDGMIKTDEVSWNTMLMGYATNGYGLEALTLFSEMRYSVVRPSAITFTGVLSACDHCGLVEEGRNLFHTMKNEYDINPGIEHYSCMVDLFSRAGCFGEAMYLIEEMPFQADANMWLSVLRGCISYGNQTIGKMAAEKIIQLDPENPGAYIQLSNVLATSEDWEGSAKVRELMRDKNVQKIPGCSWADC